MNWMEGRPKAATRVTASNVIDQMTWAYNGADIECWDGGQMSPVRTGCLDPSAYYHALWTDGAARF